MGWTSDSSGEMDARSANVLLCNAPVCLLKAYQELIRYMAGKLGYGVRFLIYESGREAVFCMDDWIQNLDIAMIGWDLGQMEGMAIARQLRKDSLDMEIIFLGNEKEDILESFGVAPFYYFIEREVTHVKFETVMAECFRKVLAGKQDSLYFTCNGRVRRVRLELIVYVRVDHRRVCLACRDGREFLFYESLAKMEERLPEESFLRIHRGYLVNLKYVDTIDKNELYLSTGVCIPIARKYRQELIDRIMEQDHMILFET